MHKEYRWALEQVLSRSGDFVRALNVFWYLFHAVFWVWVIPTENVVLFALEVIVGSCHMVHHGVDMRATESLVSHGAH